MVDALDDPHVAAQELRAHRQISMVSASSSCSPSSISGWCWPVWRWLLSAIRRWLRWSWASAARPSWSQPSPSS